MTKAIAALKKAVAVLGEATKDHKEGELVQLGAGLGEGFADREADAQALAQAVALGEKFLTKADALFLRRVLTGDVPNVDWKKLNRKAGFKMSYKARSFKIQDLMAKLLSTFETNLKDAQTKESDTLAQYTTLMDAKGAQRSKTQKALTDSDAENGARGMATEDAQAEVDALKAQVTADTGFIEQTTADLADKKEQWKDRMALRTAEMAAISKAIGILYSDDARDLMRKSESSQIQTNFLQLSQSTSAARGRKASDVLRAVSKKATDRRLSALAAKVAAMSGGHFDEVITAIDDMMDTLKKEEASDIETKESCEDDRMTDARKAAKTSRTIDEESEAIMKLEAEIATIEQTVVDNEAKIAKIDEELKAAKKMRENENTEWKSSDADDKAAAELTGMAQKVLQDFYKDNGLMLLQAKQPTIVAGAAPPPPPATFDAPYGGKTGESQGIIAILGMIVEDINKDCEKAKAEEEKAQSEYDSFKEKSEKEMQDIGDENNTLNGEKGDKVGEVKDNKLDRKTLKGELDAVMEKMTGALPNCDFMTINFDMRMKNRQTEMDGLDKAKAILQGAAFSN